MLFRDSLSVATKSGVACDITERIQQIIAAADIADGVCSVFLAGTTASLFINEDDRMLAADIEKMFERIAPSDRLYHHPSNAFAHLRTVVSGNDLTIPVAAHKLLLGAWQRVFLWEWDIEDRERDVIVTVIG